MKFCLHWRFNGETETFCEQQRRHWSQERLNALGLDALNDCCLAGNTEYRQPADLVQVHGLSYCSYSLIINRLCLIRMTPCCNWWCWLHSRRCFGHVKLQVHRVDTLGKGVILSQHTGRLLEWMCHYSRSTSYLMTITNNNYVCLNISAVSKNHNGKQVPEFDFMPETSTSSIRVLYLSILICASTVCDVGCTLHRSVCRQMQIHNTRCNS